MGKGVMMAPRTIRVKPQISVTRRRIIEYAWLKTAILRVRGCRIVTSQTLRCY
jgi:hypothetical protein